MLLFGCSLNSGSDVWALFKSFVSSNRQWQVSLVPKMVSLLLAKVADNVESAVFCGVRCSADLSEYYRRDIVFYQGCQCTPEWRQLLVSLRRTHTHSQPDRSAARYTSTTNRWDAPIAFYKTPEASCFIHHDKSLSNSKQSHGVFGVLTCLIVMLYLFEFHWRIVESFMSNADYCYALRLCSDDLRRRKKDFKSDAHWNSFFLFLFVICCVTLFSDHSSVASYFNMIISIPKKQVLMEGRQQQVSGGAETLYSCVFTTVFTLCVIQHCVCSSSWNYMIKLEYCLLFEHRYIWSPPSPRPPSASDTLLSLFVFLFIEKKKPLVWLYCFNFHPVWPFGNHYWQYPLKLTKEIVQAE